MSNDEIISFEELIKDSRAGRVFDSSNRNIPYYVAEKLPIITKIIKNHEFIESPTAVIEAFKRELEEIAPKSQEIFDLRAFKSVLEELIKLPPESSYLSKNLYMTKKRFIEQINKAIDKIADKMAEVQEVRFEVAQEKLADEEGYKELEKLKLEYDKTVEVLALTNSIGDPKAIKGNTVNLLSELRKTQEGNTND